MIESPRQTISLGELSAAAASRWGDKPALVFDPQDLTLSFAQLDRQSTQLAHALVRAGIRPGDRVAVMAANGPVFPIAWLGIAKAGAAMVPVNIAYQALDARHLLAHAGVRLAICDAERAALLRQIRRDGLTLECLIVAGAAPQVGELAWAEALAQEGEVPPPPPVCAESLANVQFTSGTTGLPKGCMLSHAYWTGLGALIAQDIVGLGPEDVMLTAQPFSYIDPQWNLAAALSSGATLVVLERFRPSQFWQKLQQHRASFFYCLGAMPSMLLAQPHRSDEREHRLRVAMCSGIPRERHAELEERFGVPWREVYGTTETGADIMVHPSDAARLRGCGSIGHPLPHREARIADADGRPLPRGLPGELQVRGIGMMDGYFGNEAATAAAFSGGWYRTGDLARMDERGAIAIVGRLKDMVRRSGENISASEVEHAIEAHPGVLISAVTGVADEVRGEEIQAYVVLKPGHAPVTLAELARHVGGQLARLKVPRYWVLCSDLPRTPSERVAKPQLRADADYCIERFDREADALGHAQLRQRAQP